jgi:hypothetical protein
MTTEEPVQAKGGVEAVDMMIEVGYVILLL